MNGIEQQAVIETFRIKEFFKMIHSNDIAVIKLIL